MSPVTVSPIDSGTYLETLASMAADRLGSRLAAHEDTLWGEQAQPEASRRLGWVDLAAQDRQAVEAYVDAAAEVRAAGLSRIVLAGMGGSSLAPEVMAHAEGAELLVVDSTDPAQVNAALIDLAATFVVIASKSGSTMETDSARRAFWQAFQTAGLNPAKHFAAITDPGSPLEQRAQDEGWRHIFLADPTVGGRFSALSAFGLVPAALIGLDPILLLDQAAAIEPEVRADAVDNPAFQLAAFLAANHQAGVQQFAVAGTDPAAQSLGAWVEQLIAESTGKLGTGVLPIAVTSIEEPDLGALTTRLPHIEVGFESTQPASRRDAAHAVVLCPLGAQFLVWEYATAYLGFLLRLNPFDQPNVEDSKAAARALLSSDSEPAPVFDAEVADGRLTISGPAAEIAQVRDAASLISRLTELVPADGYVAIQAFVDRIGHADLEKTRALVGRRVGAPVSFGFGPRFLHSTGQYHKGGHPNGVFVQITEKRRQLDLDIPGLEYTFGELLQAQANGDARVLLESGRPVFRIELADPEAAVRELFAALAGAEHS